MRKLIGLSCLSYLVIGMAHVVAGAVLEPMMSHYGLDYRDGGQFIMNQFLGFLCGVLASPWISRYTGRRNALLMALGVLTAAEAAYSFLLPWGWMLAVAPVAGIGFGMTEAVIGAIIIEFVEDKKASAMTKIETFFGLGALAMPLVAALFIRGSIWQMSFPFVTAMAGLTALLWLTLSFGKADELMANRTKRRHAAIAPGNAPVTRAGYSRATLPFLVLGIIFFAVYVGMEMSFSNYLPSIMIQRTGMDEATGASTISLFWGMIVAGRIFAGRLAERSGYGVFLITAAGAGMMVMFFISMTDNTGLSLFLIGLAGLIWAGVFAIGLVYVNQLIPGMTERTTSLLIAFGGLGGALFPKLTGWLMDRYDAVWALGLMAALTVAMFAIMAAMVLYGRRLTAGVDHKVGQ
ncbi:sugar MFS transporter [Paenibacillus tarimensis]